MILTLKHGADKKNITQIITNLLKDFKPKGVNTNKYVGKINLKEDALTIQRNIRSEW